MHRALASLVRNSRLIVFVFCLLLPFLLSPLAVSSQKESKCAFVILWVASYWLLEPIPIAVTALLPVVLLPTLGLVSSAEVSVNYMKETLMMFLGGLLVAIAVENCRLHERVALKVLLLIGTELRWLMMGFMMTTMFLSMWISNTATTAMMIPIVEALIEGLTMNRDGDGDVSMSEVNSNSLTESKERDVENGSLEKRKSRVKSSSNERSTLKTAFLLSICYSANIGGTGTLTGTGPNLVFKGFMEDTFPESEEITYSTWMMYNLPGMLLCVLIAWFYLYLVYIRCSKESELQRSRDGIRGIINKRYQDLGSIKFHEASVIVLFLLLVVLWIFREPKFIAGWASAIGSDAKIGDSVPSIAIAFFLFLIPSNPMQFNSSPPILDWKTAQHKLPWSAIILCGGGFALADAAQKSGLSELVGNRLATLSVLPAGAIVTILCFMTAVLTEVMTNTTTATILLPIISQMAISIGVNPLSLMLPVTVSCSYAFMLPAATAPNAIAFESGQMRTTDMAKPGLTMNIVCCCVQLFMIHTLGAVMFNLNVLPSWANRTHGESYMQYFGRSNSSMFATNYSFVLLNETVL